MSGGDLLGDLGSDSSYLTVPSPMYLLCSSTVLQLQGTWDVPSGGNEATAHHTKVPGASEMGAKDCSNAGVWRIRALSTPPSALPQGNGDPAGRFQPTDKMS